MSRMNRVNELIQKTLSQIILQEIEFEPNILVTISKVQTNADLKSTKIFVSVLPFDKRKQIVKILNENKSVLQNELGKNIEIKYTPKMEFYYDETEEKTEEINTLLENYKF